ncbi:hypothetical protein V6Z11_A11G388600 [Gossypium hirsutum]
MESVDHFRGYASLNAGSIARIRVLWGRFDVPLVVVVMTERRRTRLHGQLRQL